MPERGRETDVLVEDGCVAGGGGRSCYVPREHDRKVRREIANSNERRRMQSINAGFQSLRKMLQPRDGDKLSKASVLQKAVEYIYTLERDRNCLIACNTRLTCRLRALGRDVCDLDDDDCDFAAAKRRKIDTESSDEGIGGMLSPPHSDLGSDVAVPTGDICGVDGLRRQVSDLQRQLDNERRTRVVSLDERRPEISARWRRGHHSSISSSSSFASTASGMPRRGSLETIVEAIRCLEGTTDEKSKVNFDGVTSTTVASIADIHRSATDSEELVFAAAEALQFIAAGRRATAVANRVSSPWKRDRPMLSSEWHSCR